MREDIAYKEQGELSPDELRLVKRERRKCLKSFLYFLEYVKIIEPPKPGMTGGGIIPLLLWPHILVVVKALLNHSLISVLKARQIGLSTILSAYILWYALSKVGANILLFSKGQPEAKELLAKSKRIYDQLPPFLKVKLDPDSTEEIGFPSKRSSIKAFASTTSAGISYTASIVVCDEHAEHPYADENYLSSKPTRDAGGQFISVFTEDPLSTDNLATAIFEDALQGKNDFVPIFFPYDVIPGRDAEWYEHTRRNIPERDLARLSPDLYMAKNYPRSIEEALSGAESVFVFEKKALNYMRDEVVRSEINMGTEWEDFPDDIYHIFKDFHIGNFYIAGSDVSEGVGGDFAVTAILDVKTGEVVADVMSRELAPEKFALHSYNLLERYHKPLWWIEENIFGRTVIQKALELGYPKHKIGERSKDKLGFHTGDQSRWDIFGQLIPAINDGQIRIYNKDGLDQFYGMIRNMRKKGKIEAQSSKHDDYVMAVGIAWLKKDDVQTDYKSEPIHSLTFGTEKKTIWEKVLE